MDSNTHEIGSIGNSVAELTVSVIHQDNGNRVVRLTTMAKYGRRTCEIITLNLDAYTALREIFEQADTYLGIASHGYEPFVCPNCKEYCVAEDGACEHCGFLMAEE